ncbi:MAG: NYN domain-containing protein [Candidatus Eisenbacteria bacterium]
MDGQNLFHAARDAFGYRVPNFDPRRMAERLASGQGWRLDGVRFYTGLPSAAHNPKWHSLWQRRLATMGTRGIEVFAKPLRYRRVGAPSSKGDPVRILVGEEKGIDVRIAIDIIRLAHSRAYDVALVFSQDQDLAGVAAEIRSIASEQRRWIKIASAFPVGPASTNIRGIDRTDWIPIDRTLYDDCLDPRNYFDDASE